jgi:hypothetical protein
VGNLFTLLVSSDGVNWTPLASVSIAMNANVYVGLALTSHNNGVLGSATFDNIDVRVGGTILQPPAPPPSPITVRVEAEAALVVVNDVGSNGSVGISDGMLDSGRSVRLYDVNDAVRVAVNAPAAGEYRIAVRVRSGGTTGSTGFWPNGYAFKLDGAALALTGDLTSLSALDESYGGAYWGTMRSLTVTLAAGMHTVEIAALAAWGVVDYVELTQLYP